MELGLRGWLWQTLGVADEGCGRGWLWQRCGGGGLIRTSKKHSTRQRYIGNFSCRNSARPSELTYNMDDTLNAAWHRVMRMRPYSLFRSVYHPVFHSKGRSRRSLAVSMR
jgi:hypothetical protein